MEKTKAANGRIDIPDTVVSVSTAAVSAEQVYEALADLSRHEVWGGSMHKKDNYGLTSLDAPAGAASVGTEFRSTGTDPMGTFSDRSVVTEASRPSLFECVTEGHLVPKKAGKPECDTTITHRYEITSTGDGCTITYRGHIARWTNPPGELTSKLMRPIVRMIAGSYAKKTLKNLIASADQR